MITQLSPVDLVRWRADVSRSAPVLVDVREPWEIEICRIEGSLAIPLGALGERLDEIPRGQPLVLVCHHGSRSQHAAMLLGQAGFQSLHNLRGGVAAWAAEVEPTMATY